MHGFPPTDHWHDVIAGSLLGFVIANFSYRQYFPSLSSKHSHLPYAPRIELLDDIHAADLPYYRSSMDSQYGTEVELLQGTVPRHEPAEHPEQSWERGPTMEGALQSQS
jgi:diacylglycerol diphosphate phosphatase / phosphatidate phosphatase